MCPTGRCTPQWPHKKIHSSMNAELLTVTEPHHHARPKEAKEDSRGWSWDCGAHNSRQDIAKDAKCRGELPARLS